MMLTQDYDKKIANIQHEINKEVWICNLMLQNERSNEKIKAKCKIIDKHCRDMREILEKKHNTTIADHMGKDGPTYLNFGNFLRALHIYSLSDQLNQVNIGELQKVFSQSILTLKKLKFSVVLTKQLPKLKEETPKTFDDKQAYIDYIEKNIEIYGVDIDKKKPKLLNLLGQWYDLIFNLGYINKVLNRRAKDWNIITTGLSMLKWCCKSNIYTTLLLYVGGFYSDLISDVYCYTVHGKDCQKPELLKPSANARIFHNRSIDDAIRYLQVQVGRLQQQLNNSIHTGAVASNLNAICRGAGSVLTDQISNGIFGMSNGILGYLQSWGFFRSSFAPAVTKASMTLAVGNRVKDFVPHNNFSN